MKRVEHIPVPAGSAVLWDNRIPHANAYKNMSDQTRIVIYCSFLPDVGINREYAKKQLDDYLHGRIPRDQWIEKEEGTDGTDGNGMNVTGIGKHDEEMIDESYEFSPLG